MESPGLTTITYRRAMSEISVIREAAVVTGRVSIVVPCLNESENIEECVSLAFAALRDGGLDGEVIVVDNGSEDGSAALARSAGATVIEEPRRGYGQAYLTGFEARVGRLHRDDRRRPHLRLQRDPALREGARRRRGARDGQPDGLDRPGRDEHHEPHRQPDPHGLPEPAALDAGEGRALRPAGASPRRAARARPALDRDGVRLGDGDPGVEGRARGARAADRAARPRRRVEALAVPRRLAAPAADPDLQPDGPVHRPRDRDGRVSAR